MPECAFFGLSGSLVSDMGVTTRHSYSLQGGNNEAGRVEKGAIGCVALNTYLVTFEKAKKIILSITFRAPERGQLSFLG